MVKKMYEIIKDIIQRDDYKPLKFKDFCYLLRATKPREKQHLQDVLNEMVENKELFLNDKDKYAVYGSTDLKKGKYRAGKGTFGFVELEDDFFDDDIYISAENSKNAYNNDIVLLKIIKPSGQGRKAEGKIVKILERASQIYVGTFHKNKNFGFVTLKAQNDEEDVFIPKTQFNGAKHMDMVQIEITKFPQFSGQKREGKVLEVLGFYKDDGMDITALIYKYNLPNEFDAKIIAEAQKLSELNLTEELALRRDLTNENVITIDGKTAKDLDDAVCVKKTENGYKLFVSIADVSFYVKERSLIDIEAYERGTSVYFPDRAVSMLPRALSENLCSLNPNEIKLTFTAEMDIDNSGKVTQTDFYKSFIRSKARMVYNEVNDLYDRNTDGLKKEYLLYENDLLMMKELASVLRDRRMKQGAIDLDIDEAFIEVDNKGNAIDVYPEKRGDAEKIIEDFMLCANKSVAEYIFHTGIPSIYRVHEEPDKEKLDTFIRFASLMGYKLRLAKQRYSAQLNDFVESIKNTDEEFLLKKVLLRCMKKAEYRSDSTSHFALAFMYYTHFTSPIRRYPDLIVHRILSKIIEGTASAQYIEYLSAGLPQIAYDCSRCERRAEEAQREGDKIKIAQYMAKHKGEIFEGIISSVLNFGIFVQLSNMAEGLVRFADIADDYYQVDLDNLRAVGERTKRVLKVGDKVFAEVFRANRENGEIDLLLLNEDEVEEF